MRYCLCLGELIGRGGVILLGIISFASVGLVTWLSDFKGISMPLIAYAGPFPIWCVFFGLGCYLSKTDREYSLAVPSAFVITGIVLQYAECHWLNSLSGGGFGIKMSAWVYAVASILVLFSSRLELAYKRNIVSRFVEHVGDVSFTVYLYHLLVLIVLSRLGVSALPWIGKWAALMLATLAFVKVAKRILPKKTRWLIGV